MTDKERLAALLTEFGVGFTEDCVWYDRGGYPGISMPGAELGIGVNLDAIVCEEGSAKVVGFCMVAIFAFDDEGRFVVMGVRE